MLRSSLLALAALCIICSPVLAGGEAFIGHGDGTAGAWGRDLTIRDALETDLGFQTVRMNADSTPKELANLVSAFLEQPGERGARRFVWISGPIEGVDSPCPSEDLKMIKPAASALILVPDCYAEFIDLPRDTLHVSLRGIPATQPNSLNEIRASAVSVVVVTLPSDSAAAIKEANEVVFSAIKSASEDGVSGANILQRLRHELRVDGSEYTPTLEAYPAHAAWSRRYLTASTWVHKNRATISKTESLTPPLRRPNQSRTALHIRPSAMYTTEDAIWIQGREPFTVFRSAIDGKIGYVRTGNGLFGWVKIDALD